MFRSAFYTAPATIRYNELLIFAKQRFTKVDAATSLAVKVADVLTILMISEIIKNIFNMLDIF